MEGQHSLAAALADVFNHVHQSHGPDVPNDVVLADCAGRIGRILSARSLCSLERFYDLASMSGLEISEQDRESSC